MSYSTKMRSAVCVSALVAGGAAQADVTAQQVWDSWKEQAGLYGENNMTVGAETQSGDTLVVSDIAFTYEDSDVSVSAELGDITFEEQNGTVRVTMAESYPISITNPGADDTISLTVVQDGLQMIVSGDPEAMSYDVAADRYAIVLDQIVSYGEEIDAEAEISMVDLAGEYTIGLGDMYDISYDLEVGSLGLTADFKNPETEGEYLTVNAEVADLAMNADMSLPTEMDFENPEALDLGDTSMVGGYTSSGANYTFDANMEGDQAAGSFTSGEAVLDFHFDKQSVAYSAKSVDIAGDLTTSAFPFPIEISLAEYGASFEMPLGKTEEPADFGLSIDIVDLAVNDMIWNLFDAGAVLPRDPATLQIAIAGKAKALFDMLDPDDQMAMAMADVPFELESLDIERLKLSLAGADVNGDGAFTFDNTDLATFGGFPRPIGDATVNIDGLNGLIDNLVQMGLVPQDQVMAPRMMMGMFMDTVGDDQMRSRLEVNDEGHVIVNGQRLR